MNLPEIINPELITFCCSIHKKEVIQELISLLYKKNAIPESLVEPITKNIFYREELMSTGIGRNLGIPHIRMSGITKPIIALGIQPNGISDYESMDSLPVKLVFLILCEKGQHRVHIQLLSQIVKTLNAENVINRILEAQDCEQVYQIILKN